jgi:stearoyl-CoA desaturase (delta-9 desaturase)
MNQSKINIVFIITDFCIKDVHTLKDVVFIQRDVYTWALDHRVHHKYSETDADPHNAKRGFLFAHVGWLFTTPHPDVVAKRKAVDMSDLEADPIVMWQKR